MKGTGLADREPDQESQWLVSAATECGLSSASMGGVSAVTWSEIRAWQESTGDRGYWLAKAVRTLSLHFVDEYHAAKDPHRPAPAFADMEEDERRAAVVSQFKNFVRAKK
jgi:hypothetical protein